MRKYTLNENFFENIDTEEKAYWLGFITADGHWRTNGTLQINLKGSDIDHLRKLAAALDFDGPVYQYLNIFRSQKFPRSRIAVCSKKLCDDIQCASLVPVKRHLIWDFWRGVVDGDGHLDNYTRPRIRLVGALEVVARFAESVKDVCPTRASVRPHYSIWQFEIGSNKARQVIDKLYGRATVALDRKLSVAREILGHPQAQVVMI